MGDITSVLAEKYHLGLCHEETWSFRLLLWTAKRQLYTRDIIQSRQIHSGITQNPKRKKKVSWQRVCLIVCLFIELSGLFKYHKRHLDRTSLTSHLETFPSTRSQETAYSELLNGPGGITPQQSTVLILVTFLNAMQTTTYHRWHGTGCIGKQW